MPTRKQRRRRDKTFRHEYDLVVYDEEGNEVPVDTSELRSAKGKPKKKAQRGGSRTKRPPREVLPATWARAVKKGGLMGAVLLLLMFAIKGPIVLGVIYGVALIPFTYWLDRRNYSRYISKS